MKTDLSQSCGHCWVFQVCWHIECSTLTTSSFRIWNSLTGIPSPPLALFIVMLLKAHLTSHPRISGSRWMITPLPLARLMVILTLSLGKTHSFLVTFFYYLNGLSCQELFKSKSHIQFNVHSVPQTFQCGAGFHQAIWIEEGCGLLFHFFYSLSSMVEVWSVFYSS